MMQQRQKITRQTFILCGRQVYNRLLPIDAMRDGCESMELTSL